MTRKMLDEEKRMLRFITALTVKENHKVIRKAFREAVLAVREDCAKVATGKNDACGKCAEEIAGLIRGRK